MEKIIKKYQTLFTFMIGALIFGLFLGGIVYLFGIKNKLVLSVYAEGPFRPSEAIVKCLGIDKEGNAYLVRMYGQIEKWSKGNLKGSATLAELAGLYRLPIPFSKKAVSAISNPAYAGGGYGFGYSYINAKGEIYHTAAMATGDYLGQLLPFQNFREVWLSTTASNQTILKYGIYYPVINAPSISVDATRGARQGIGFWVGEGAQNVAYATGDKYSFDQPPEQNGIRNWLPPTPTARDIWRLHGGEVLYDFFR